MTVSRTLWELINQEVWHWENIPEEWLVGVINPIYVTRRNTITVEESPRSAHPTDECRPTDSYRGTLWLWEIQMHNRPNIYNSPSFKNTLWIYCRFAPTFYLFTGYDRVNRSSLYRAMKELVLSILIVNLNYCLLHLLYFLKKNP